MFDCYSSVYYHTWQYNVLSEQNFFLTEIDCEALRDPANGQVLTTVGGIATYSCSKGFRLSASSTRACSLSGNWSGLVPICNGWCIVHFEGFSQKN